MKRIMQWANFKAKGGDVVSYPMLVDEAAGGLKIRGPAPQDSELISVTRAQGGWADDDGLIVDAIADPAEWTKKKAEVLRLADQGLDHYKIAAAVGAGVSTVRNWLLVAGRVRKSERAAASTELADRLILANPDLSARKLAELLQSQNIRKGKTWVIEARARLAKTGGE